VQDFKSFSDVIIEEKKGFLKVFGHQVSLNYEVFEVSCRHTVGSARL
jgi:hypothetical protein